MYQVYLLSRPAEEKKDLPFRPAEEKNYIPSRPAGEKTIYRPFPSRKKIFTVPSRPSNILIPHFTGPFSFFFPAKLGKSVPSRPVTILIHCDSLGYY